MSGLQIRRGVEHDRQALMALLAANQMNTHIEPAEFWVAVVDEILAGAIRLEWEDQAAYLRPIVVAQEWHGKGIGRALVQVVIRDLPVLKLVARGEAVGFYSRLGFSQSTWDEVPERYRQECADCPDREECLPVPMKLVKAVP